MTKCYNCKNQSVILFRHLELCMDCYEHLKNITDVVVGDEKIKVKFIYQGEGSTEHFTNKGIDKPMLRYVVMRNFDGKWICPATCSYCVGIDPFEVNNFEAKKLLEVLFDKITQSVKYVTENFVLSNIERIARETSWIKKSWLESPSHTTHHQAQTSQLT